VAQPVRTPAEDESPTIDPVAVHQAYRRERARRRIRHERQRATKHARRRFWVVLVLLLAASVFLSVTLWHEIERLFGL